MKSTIQLENQINENSVKKSNIMQSQIFNDESNDSPKLKNTSFSPFNNLNGMSLKGFIMPFGNFNEVIKEEENEDFGSNMASQKASTNNNLNISGFVFGNDYMGDDDEEEGNPKKDEIKDNNDNNNFININNNFNSNKSNKIKKSSILGMSLNNNVFGFNNQYDEEYVGELKDEINQLYKNRDKMEDEIAYKDEKLKQSMIKNDELKKIIEQQKKEIEDLKKKEL